MAAQKAESIQAKFSADHPGRLSDSETRFWARLNRLFDGDLDAFDKPESSAEDAEYERLAALVETQGMVPTITGELVSSP